MKTPAKINLSIIVLLLFFIIGVASCSTKKAFSDAENWIPPGFNPNNGVLLISSHPHNKEMRNKKMINWLQKNYPYPYEIGEKKEIYGDNEKYPFVVIWRVNELNVSAQNSNGTNSTTNHYELYGQFQDRSTGKVYPITSNRNKYGYFGYQPFFNSIIEHFR
jgi:hypothetical protein